jgi:hypothetical protein
MSESLCDQLYKKERDKRKERKKEKKGVKRRGESL